MITKKSRPLFYFLFSSILLFSKVYSSDTEFPSQELNKGHLQGFPKELIKLITNHMSFLSIVRASIASNACHTIFDQEINWEDMVQTIPGHERYKDFKMPAKQVFIALMKPEFHISKSTNRKELPAHYMQSMRLWSIMYGKEIVDEFVTKDELRHHGPFRISLTAFNEVACHQLIAGKILFECKNLPFLYLENHKVELWENILLQAHILPPAYTVQEILTISEDGNTFAGVGSKTTEWAVHFPDPKSFQPYGIDVFDYRQLLTNSKGFKLSIQPEEQQPNQFVSGQTKHMALSHEYRALLSQEIADLLE